MQLADPTVAIPRRTALGAFVAVVAAACGSSAPHPASGGGAPAGSATPTLPAPTPSGEASEYATKVVRGSNAYVTREVLASDADAYNGTWRATLADAATGTHATFTAHVRIDPDARTFTGSLDTVSDLLPGAPLPAFTYVVDADSFTYDGDTGAFAIHALTDIGRLTITSDKGVGTGTFVYRIDDIPGHTDVTHIEARGVAFRPSAVPVDLTVAFADGHTLTSKLTFTMGS